LTSPKTGANILACYFFSIAYTSGETG
jgi:hypothetical protein